jgi:hypothetical protein
MKKLLATLALSALVGTSAFAAGKKGPTEAQKEKKDKVKEGQDAKGAAGDQKKAHDEYVKAAQEDQAAVKHHAAAEAAWTNWHKELNAMYIARATARRLRTDAAKLNKAAANLIHAEHLRGQALDARLGADALAKRAHGHLVAAGNAEATIKECERAAKDLQGNPALANAIADIKKDEAVQVKVRDDNRAAAKADEDIAHKLLAEATTWENQATGLEKPPVAVVHFVPKPPAKPVAIVAKPKK